MAMLVPMLNERLFAGSVLEMLPADVPGFLILPHITESNDRLTAIASRISGDYRPREVNDLTEELGIPEGSCDASKPIVLIFTRPTFDRSDCVVAFHPADPGAFRLAHGLNGSRSKRVEVDGKKVRILMRKDIAFVSRRLLPLRVLRNVNPNSSALTAMDDADKSHLSGGDVVVHLNLKRWRERIAPILALATNMMQLGIAAEGDAQKAAAAREVLQWFGSGITELVAQMDSVTLSVQLSDDAIRIEHRHRFAPGGGVCRYLGGVTRESSNLLKTLPDRAFWMAGVSNWRCPPGEDLTTRLTEFVMNKEVVGPKLSSEKVEQIISDVRCCYGQMKGSSFMLSSQKGLVFPMEMIGSYILEDAVKGVKQICFIQENANEAMSFLMPTGDLGSKFERLEKDGLKYAEMKLNFDSMKPALRQQLEQTYGPRARFQNAMISPTEVVFCMAEPPLSVITLAQARKAGMPTLDQNEEVRRITSFLQPEPNIIVLLDLDRLIAAAPQLATQSSVKIAIRDDHKSGPADTPPYEVLTHSKSLLGWSCVVQRGELTGRLAIDVEDAVSAAKGIRRIAKFMGGRH